MKIDDPASIDEYYIAFIHKDPHYMGQFIAGVKTTGIFCIPTCHAKKPHKQNTEFFTGMDDALRYGYRPCKICKPAETISKPPADIKKAMDLLHKNKALKIGDADLRAFGLQPEKIRRWFNANYGITFQAYQRMVRINTAYQELSAGKTVTESAFSSGYDSLSGFGYTVKKMLGCTPEQLRTKKRILLERIVTPLGPMFIGATDEGICMCEFTDRRMLETEFRDLQVKLDAIVLISENRHTRQLKSELSEYFAGHRTRFSVAIDAPGTDFQRSVWSCLQTIPFGETASYQIQAEKLTKPKAVRAVANANGANRIAIVIPCHRVIGKDGTLTGYGGGLDRKKWLLDHEKQYKN